MFFSFIDRARSLTWPFFIPYLMKNKSKIAKLLSFDGKKTSEKKKMLLEVKEILLKMEKDLSKR
jgi:hypothetical protein